MIGRRGDFFRTSWGVMHTSFKHTLETAQSRLILVGALFCLAMGAILVRLGELTLLKHHEDLLSGTDDDGVKQLRLGRADMVDRHGQLLATTISTTSVYANSRLLLDPVEAAMALSAALPKLNQQDLLKRFQSGQTFVWIARHLTPAQRMKVLRLGIPGLTFVKDQRRLYPLGRLVSHVMGFTDVDNRGVSGLEKGLDDVLRAGADPVVLSLDLRLQHIVHDELNKGIAEFGARGGCALVLDSRTGEVLSLVSLPDFDPNHPGRASTEALFNKVTLGIYEMGSTLKIANTALALDTGVADLTTRFDATQPLKVGRYTITDYRGKNAWLSLAEVFVHSSNIGSAKIALMAGALRQRQFLKKLGYLDKPSFELPEIGAPLVPKDWPLSTTITVSYGYGLSISPLQLVTGVGSLIGGGQRLMPTLLKRSLEGDGQPIHSSLYAGDQKKDGIKDRPPMIFSKENSIKLLSLMRLVTLYGTARKANVPGYYVFAKTGTSNLRSGRGYQKDKVMTNFVGVLGRGIQDPRYIIYIMLEDPKRLSKTYGFNTAGWNAAPIGGRVIGRMAPLLGIGAEKTLEFPRDGYLKTLFLTEEGKKNP